MDALAPFRIPMSALKADSDSFDWAIGPDFFNLFDEEHQAPVGHFKVSMELERTGLLVTLDFDIKGSLQTTCDRCMVPIDMKVENTFELIIKFGDPEESTDEVIFIDPESPELNVGKSIYDFILLSIPISHRIPNCETLDNPPCDMSIVNYLNENKIEEVNPEEQNLLWDQLRKAIDN
jgi:uncharacterized metal-binding protein YceD (DUF177 family)